MDEDGLREPLALGTREALRVVELLEQIPASAESEPLQVEENARGHDRAGPAGAVYEGLTRLRALLRRDVRGAMARRLGKRYPGYGLECHSGYGRPEHKVALAKLGPTPEHRLSVKACRPAEAVGAAPARRPKPRPASWRELPAEEKAAHLLATPQIADRVWTDQPRLHRETRAAFIRRVILGETEPAEA